MSPADSHSTKHATKQKVVRWLAIALMAILIVVAGLATVLAMKWPFSEGRITHSLEASLHGRVHISSFHSSVFPHPGCIIKGFSLVRPQQSAPIATADKLTINAAYLDLFLRPNYIRQIVVENLHVQLHRGSKSSADASAQPDSPSMRQQPQSKKGSATRVGQIIANNSTLDVFPSGGKKPLTFQVHSLVLDSVGLGEAMGYKLAMTNALPPGEISSHGRLGPWNTHDVKETPLFGTSYFERANLGVFSGVAGTLSSRNDFAGTLGNIEVNGNADVPDFKVKRAKASLPLRAHFTALLNAITGELELQRAEAWLLQTHIEVRGRVARLPGHDAKVTAMDFRVHDGRIQDVIGLFAQDKPPLNGITDFRAHTVTHSFGMQFLKETELEGQFQIRNARFTNPQRQASIDELSVRAERNKPSGRAPEVTAEFHGQVSLKTGVAHFRNLSMSIPAATAQMNGMYNLIDEQIDFHGTLSTQAQISKTTHGIKSVLLKPLDPLFKKKSAGAVVHAQMTGTYDHPQFAIIVASKTKTSGRNAK